MNHLPDPELPNRRPTPISLDQLTGLADEMSALVRCGVPLEKGLMNLGRDVPGELSRLAQRLAVRLQAGTGLAKALEVETIGFPPVFGTVVEAGLKSGQLSVALEGMATTARRLAQLRRTIGLAVVYPLVVFLLAYGLFVFFVLQMAPKFQQSYASFRLPPHPLLEWLVGLGRSVEYWGPVLPIVAIVMAVLWWHQSGRGLLVDPSHATRWLGWIPWAGKMLRYSQAAIFAEVFALLVEHHVRLDEAVRLAAEASGQRELLDASQAIERGEPLSAGLTGTSPLLGWLLASHPREEILVRAARNAANHYRARAADQAELVQLLLPVLLTVALGGAVTILYGMTLFVPWSNLLRSLA